MKWKYFSHEFENGSLLSVDEGVDCYHDYVPAFVNEQGYLPKECRDCFKALIFWEYSSDNEKKFKSMLEAIPASINGKYNESVVVFYFKSKENMVKFLELLKEKMAEFDVEGRIQWRVSGRYWQDAYPEFFISAKELCPIDTTKEIGIKQWLIKQRILEQETSENE